MVPRTYHGSAMDVAASGRWQSLVTIVTSSAALVTLAVLGTASRYVADDFGFPIAILRHGFWKSQWIWYRTWSGRVSATFASTSLAVIGDWTPAVLPALIILAWVIAAAIAAKRLGAVDSWSAAAIGVAFVYACCDGAAQPYQTLLWQTGSLTYAVPLVAVTAMVLLVLAKQTRAWIDMAIALLALFIAMFSETLAVCSVLVAVVVAVLAPSNVRRRAMFAVAGALTGLAVVVLAPGNAVRRAHFPRSAPLSAEIRMTAEVTVAYFANFFRRAGVQFLLMLTVSLIATRPGAVRPRTALAATAIAVAAALVLVYLPVHVGYGRPPARGLITADFFLFSAVFFAGAAAAHQVRGATRIAVMAATALLLIAGPCAAVLYNVRLAGGAQSFARRWDSMDARLRASRGKDVIVGMPVTVGGLAFLSPDPRAEINRTVAEFYGVRSITNAQPSVP